HFSYSAESRVRVALPGQRFLAEGGSADHHSRWIVFSTDRFAPGSSGESAPGQGLSVVSSPVLAGHTDLRIMILGKSDVGKTATANTIMSRNAFRAEAQSDTLTCEKQDAVVSGRNISIIDTPGWLDAPWYKHFQDELKRDINKCLEMSAPGPHVFLLVIRLNGIYTEEEKNTVKWIQMNFGEDAVRHTFVVFTHVDLLKDESLDQYIRKSPDLQLLMDSCGGRFHSFNNQHRNNQNQATELLEKIEQLIKDNGGEHYANEKSRKKKQEKMRHDNSQEDTKKNLHDLTRETDELLTLMMGLEMSEMQFLISFALLVYFSFTYLSHQLLF
uniref:AIG1-type G domain-containing protein n=1 Tax=Sinocyclocheilus grahami TaxID=75366 RepID=A0A672KER0_SINGR